MADGCFIRQNPIGHAITDLAETRCGLKAMVILRLVGRVPGCVSIQLHSPSAQSDNSFRSAFGSVTQIPYPVMGRFDFGELTGNKLLS
jgi:hypothetical protein